MTRGETIKKCMMELVPINASINERDAKKLRKLIAGDYSKLYINAEDIEDFFVYDDDDVYDRDGHPSYESGQDLISLLDYMA